MPRLAIFAIALTLVVPVSADEVGEILVSARKREERLQDVPLSIAAYSDEDLRARNVQTIYDVATFTPNFSFNRNSVGRRLDAPSIRGQFTPLANFGTEANVAFFVDGVYISGTASGLTIDNLERVEVLRGPQATQFGRGAFAGAINYITKAPSNEVDGQLYLKAGEESDFKTSGYVSGPLIEDRLFGLISASWESVDGEWINEMKPCPFAAPRPDCIDLGFAYKGAFPDDGQPPSSVTDDFTPLGGEAAANVTAKLTWQATDDLRFNLKGEYGETDDEHFASLFQPDLNCYLPDDPGDRYADIVNPESPGWRCGEIRPDGLSAAMNIADLREGVTSNLATARPAPFIGTQTESQRYLVEGILGRGGWEYIARASYNEQELESYRDLDRSPYFGPVFYNLFASGELQKWEDTAYEIRASSPRDDPVRGSLGVYYFSSEQISFQREYTGFCNRVEYGLPLVDDNRSWNLDAEKENIAIFGSADYDISEDVTLTVEGRYAKDSPTQRAPNGVVATADYKSFIPRFTLRWQITEDASAYWLLAKGNKPGGFYYGYFDAPVLAADTREALANGKALIKEEEAITHEVGFKTQWFDRRVTANVSVYYIDWTNQSINQVEGIPWTCSGAGAPTEVANNIVRNAGRSQVWGSEVELVWDVTENLRLELNYGLANTELLEFNSLTIDSLIDPAVLSARGLLGNNARGKEAPRVPKHTLAASASYRHALGDRGAEWFVRGDYVYNAKSWLDAENEAYVGALNLVNARVGIESEAWTAALYVDNLTDDDTPLLASTFPDFGQFPFVDNAFHIVPRRGRNAGLTLTWRF